MSFFFFLAPHLPPGDFIQPLLWSHGPLPGHLRDVILSVFFVSFLWLSLQSALPVFFFMSSGGDSWAASLPGSTGFTQCRGAAQFTGPLGFLSILPSYRDCASSLQRASVWQLESLFFFFFLSSPFSQRWPKSEVWQAEPTAGRFILRARLPVNQLLIYQRKLMDGWHLTSTQSLDGFCTHVTYMNSLSAWTSR